MDINLGDCCCTTARVELVAAAFQLSSSCRARDATAASARTLQWPPLCAPAVRGMRSAAHPAALHPPCKERGKRNVGGKFATADPHERQVLMGNA